MKKSLLILFAAMIMSACAKEFKRSESSQPAIAPVPTPPVININNGPSSLEDLYSFGSTTAFTPDSRAIFEQYVVSHTINDPQNMAINVNLVEVDGDKNIYGGSVRIRYVDTGEVFEGVFRSGASTVSGTYRDNGKNEAEYNQFFQWEGKEVFHGFFSDTFGAIVLVIDDIVDLGDGTGSTAGMSGSVWFKNFNSTVAPPSPNRCWFIYPTIGGHDTPYDCRTFLVNGHVDTTSALYPNRGYVRLGTFQNLNRAEAFNEE